jgi:hypothetical protein
MLATTNTAPIPKLKINWFFTHQRASRIFVRRLADIQQKY